MPRPLSDLYFATSNGYPRSGDATARRGATAVLANQVNSDGRLIGREERRDDGPDDGFREAKEAVRTAQPHRLVHGLEEAEGRGETRRAHVWHTHRNRRADGRPSAEAVPWTTYLWWGETRRIFLLSLLLTVLRPRLFLFFVGPPSAPASAFLAYPAVRSCKTSLHREIPCKSLRSFLPVKSEISVGSRSRASSSSIFLQF